MDIVEIGLKLTYALLAIGVVAAIIMPLYQAVTSNPKSLVRASIGVGFLLIVYLIGYSISSDEVTPIYTEFGVDAGTSQIVGGLLIAMYLLMIVAIVGILFTEVSKLLK